VARRVDTRNACRREVGKTREELSNKKAKEERLG
jgi:hypothetical protein